MITDSVSWRSGVLVLPPIAKQLMGQVQGLLYRLVALKAILVQVKCGYGQHILLMLSSFK